MSIKIHVCRAKSEWITSMTNRTFDGTCRISNYISGINVYSNVGNNDFSIYYFISYNIALMILEYIIKFYEEGSDEVFDWSYKGDKIETYDLSLSQEISDKIASERKYIDRLNVYEPTADKKECPVFLNPIVLKIVSDELSKSFGKLTI